MQHAYGRQRADGHVIFGGDRIRFVVPDATRPSKNDIWQHLPLKEPATTASGMEGAWRAEATLVPFGGFEMLHELRSEAQFKGEDMQGSNQMFVDVSTVQRAKTCKRWDGTQSAPDGAGWQCEGCCEAKEKDTDPEHEAAGGAPVEAPLSD